MTQITVGELIALLVKYPSDAKVYGSTYGDLNGGFFTVETIEDHFGDDGVVLSGGWNNE